MSKAATTYLEITENRFNFIYTTRNLLRYLLVFVKSVMHKFDVKYTARYKRKYQLAAYDSVQLNITTNRKSWMKFRERWAQLEPRKKKENRKEQVESHAIAMAADFDNTSEKDAQDITLIPRYCWCEVFTREHNFDQKSVRLCNKDTENDLIRLRVR